MAEVGALEIGVLALGLAADATAVAATRGMSMTATSVREAMRVGLVFGAFQAGMPALGWALGAGVGDVIAAVDHWIAFAILALLGGRMIWGAVRGDEAPPSPTLSWRMLLVLAVATSIDALAAGITLPLMGAPLGPTIVTIGVLTAVLSGLAVVLGRHLGARFAGRVTIIGGVILIGIGTKILIEHLTSGT